MAAGPLRQLRVLLWKNWIFSIRSWKSTLLQLLAPCFFLVLVTALSYLPQGVEDVLYPKPAAIGKLPKCQGWNGQSCISLYVISSNPPLDEGGMECVHTLVEKFASDAGLDVNNPHDVFHDHDPLAAYNNLTAQVNTTQAALLFTSCDPANSRLNYTILYNSTRALRIEQLVFGSPNKPDGRSEIQIGIDQAFMSMVWKKNVNVSTYSAPFPKIYQQPSQETKQATSATLFLFCAITFQFVMMMYNVVSEKDLKLRQGLTLIGMKDSLYWLSWTITGLVIALLSTCVLMATGYACQLQFFLNTNFLINFLLFLIYSASMIPLAFFASVFINTIRLAVNVGMLVFVVGLMIISMLANSFLLTQLYVFVMPLVYVLSFLPPFHLAKAMADIGLAGSVTDSNGLPKSPYHYGWSNMTNTISVIVFSFGSDPNKPPTSSEHFLPATYVSFLLLVADALFYGVLFWYLDSVIAGNHSIPRKWYFPLQPSYWIGDRACKSGSFLAADSEERPLLSVRPQSYSESAALEVHQLTKVFKNRCTQSFLSAVDNLSLTVHKNQILSLLGHNGAGKSTTINMLTGLLEPNRGDAFFFGVSVRKNLAAVRSMLGVCPQHDILWNDLTAREHMQLFAEMKGIPSKEMREEIDALLERVQLMNVAGNRVGTFSGGMKRRLTVAMCFLGNPQIIFLDEPTTGMDPRIRRDIWNLILQMKENRVTIMTTHSMEEADILGDTIVIMANGQLRVMGTSVALKNRFAGYNVELIVKRDHVLEMMNLVSAQLTGAMLKGGPFEVEDGILLPYNLPPECHGDIAPFFRVLENESQIADILLDYSISQTTLEEVFMNVTVDDAYQDREYQPRLRRSSRYGSTSGSLSPRRCDPRNI